MCASGHPKPEVGAIDVCPRSWLDAPREPESDARGDHGCSACVDGLDELVGVDALQVDRGDAEVAVAELALDDVEGNPLMSELDGVGVAELVRGKAPANAGPGGESAQHGAS